MSRVRIDPTSRQPIGPVPEERVVVRLPKPKTRYVELTTRSCFSFLQAASPPEELIQRAAAR